MARLHTLRRRGLSLIELLIVIAVAGLLLALVAPSMQGMIAAQRVKAINAELLTDIQFARSEALRRHQPVNIAFPVGNNTCYVVYVAAVIGSCDCTRGVGVACNGGNEEIKTVSTTGASNVVLNGRGFPTGDVMSFSFENARSEAAGQNYYQVDVQSSYRGQLRTRVQRTGAASVCSPDGSITEVPRCT